MYDLCMKMDSLGIRLDRVLEEMNRHSLDGKILAARAGVSEGAISKLINGKSPGMSAVNLASVAEVLKVSVDYLMGLTSDPIPKSLTQEELIVELVRVSHGLTDRRRRDLLMTARAYLRASDELKADPDLLMDNMLDLIKEAGGSVSRDQLEDLLEADADEDEDDSLGGDIGSLPNDGEEPPDGED